MQEIHTDGVPPSRGPYSQAILRAGGTSLDDVTKVTARLVDIENDFEGFNEVYAEYTSEPYPARTTIPIYELYDDRLRLEIEVVAEV